jgi:hypothetical protein
MTLCLQSLEQQLVSAQDALQKKDLEVQVCKVEFDGRSAEERLRFASEIKARNEELLALRVDRDDCVRQWSAEKSAMQEEIKVRFCVLLFFLFLINFIQRLLLPNCEPAAEEPQNWKLL